MATYVLLTFFSVSQLSMVTFVLFTVTTHNTHKYCKLHTEIPEEMRPTRPGHESYHLVLVTSFGGRSCAVEVTKLHIRGIEVLPKHERPISN